MRRPALFGSAVAVALVVGIASPGAHHGNAVYDTRTTVTVKGTVAKWQLINPHAGLWIDAKTDAGTAQQWSAEFGGVVDLYRTFRWNKDTFKPGDEVAVIGNPARDGRPAMLARKVIVRGVEIDLEGT